MEEKNAPSIARLAGRLGNCMFQIANAATYAKRSGRPFFFHYGDGQGKDKQYSEILSRFKEMKKIPENTIRYREKDSVEETLKGMDFDLQKPVYFDGYYQNQQYINRDYILELFKAPEGLKEKVFEKYGDLSDCVSIHVRRGDFVSLGLALTPKWYNDAYKKYFNGQRAFICSDDIEWCKKNLNIKNAIFSEGNDAIFDLYACSFCKNHISSNGSFGWWGAYLGRQEGSVTVIKDDRNSVLPDGWINFESKK